MKQFSYLLLGLILALSLSYISTAKAFTFNAGTALQLITAINSANSNGEDDVIVLTGNITLLVVNNSLLGDTGLPSITENGTTLTIIGNGFTISRSGAPDFRIFSVSGGGDLSLVNVIVSNGSAIGGPDPDFLGGGVYVANGGTLSLTNSTIIGNSAQWGGGIANSEGTVTLTNSSIRGNTALDAGGGIYNVSFGAPANLTINSSTISGNTVSGTSQQHGAGIYNDGGTITINNSTISGNNATGGVNRGGGILNTNSSSGATGTMTITNSTIVGNSAASSGGGLAVDDGTVTLRNTIIAGNSATTVPSTSECNNAATTNTNANNLFGVMGTAGGCPVGVSDLTGAGAIGTIVNGLASNGGPTQTRSLPAGSQAIDAANDGNCSNTDQRGVPRGFDGDGTTNSPQTGDCDIGAFEFGLTPTYPTIQFASAGTNYNETDGTVSITLNISGAANFSGIATVYVVDDGPSTAISGADYSPVNLQTITIDCSSGTCPTTLNASLTILTDNLLENNETALLRIRQGNGFATIGAQDSFTATILAQTAIATLSANDAAALENPVDNGQFTITLLDPISLTPLINDTGAINVSYTVTGTATNGTDYTTISGTASIPNGSASTTINIVPLDDGLAEGIELVTLTLTGTNNANVSVNNTPADVAIGDDELPSVVITPTSFNLVVGSSRTYDVFLSVEPTANVTITLTQLDANCTISTTTLTFTDSLGASPWNVPQQITVTGVGAVGATCTIQHTPTGGGYTGVVASNVVVTIVSPAFSSVLFDPAISKLGFLQTGQVGIIGEKLEWKVTVSNTSNVVGQNVTITDTLIPALQIDSVSAPNANVTINGQMVTVVYPALNIGQTVEFSIFTTVLQGTSISNTACVNATNQGAEECATGMSVSRLPSTGERSR